ncbi:MAG: DUF4826 family protein [Paludibacter sp.]|nr:DUF4826 family protein [Paludibacter sp.]
MVEINKINDQSKGIEAVEEVIALSIEAQKYLNSFVWCNKILNGWLVKDWGYMLCIFYFEIDSVPQSGADKFVWIIVGDLPSAYIDIESAHNELEAFEVYVFLMEEWITNVEQGKSVDDCFPINVKPSKKHANMLSNRVKIIKSDFITELLKSGNSLNAK